MTTYISKEELMKMIREKKNVLVVDVRDDDYIGGHIIDSVHIPSKIFPQRVEKFAQGSIGRDVVVFHCMLSQVRGVKAARLYEETRQSLGLPDQKVCILRGGFDQWQQSHGSDETLTSGWLKDLWE